MATKSVITTRIKKTTAPKRSGKQEAVAAEETTTSAVDRAMVAQRAYERFIARGMTHGHDLEDWLAAEQELGETN